MGSSAGSVSYTESPLNGPSFNNDAHSSGVSWGAVIGGAFVAAALSLIMLALGAGLGLSSVSPWSNAGASAQTVSTAAIVWLIVIEFVACAMGGYLTGRLRTRWHAIHTDEVYFRDTANGFLVWAVALVITAAFLGSFASTMVGSAASATAAIAKSSVDPSGYFVDTLFRADPPSAVRTDPTGQAEAGRILANSLRQDGISAPDKNYLAQLVAAKTGISQADAQQRVTDVIADARQAEDSARKAAARLLLWTFIALLIGAFSASFAATIGGRQRDHMKLI